MNSLLLIILQSVLLLNTVNSDEFQSVLGHLKTKTNESTQAMAVLDLIKRLLPSRVTEFSIEIDRNFGPVGKDTFYIRKTNDIIKITATTGVAAAWGFHHYLKYFCNAHISWESQQLHIPLILPDANITISSNDRFRYYQNVCTTSYSFVWWKWKNWEQHIDWMALNGINLALAFNGQEAIWKRVYRKFNISEDEIDEHFAGPAFLSWSRMGNIRGWAGPLPDSWHPRSLNLQRQIVQRMRDLGIITVLPGFSGHVPRAFQRLFPEAKIIKLKTWNNFQDKYCCPYLLDPTDQLFITIGITFMQEQIAEFGTDHVYNCDTFNEMVPQNGDTDYLRNISTSIYSSMTDADPKAIWLLQSWMFYSEILYWNKSLVKAFISAVPKGRMIILDLQSEQFPQYNRLESYFGQPFIWCMLHNFGGTLGMFGSANIINTETFNGRNFENSTMIGTGLTPEGINQNYVIYDLMTEMFWRKEPANLNEWFKMYAIRRYGQQNEYAIKAWNILSTTVYDYNSIQKMRGKYIVSRSPKLNLKPTFWYNTTEFMYAWDNLLTAQDDLKENLGYKHDLVDVTRQVLQIFGDLYYNELIRSFRKKKINKFMSRMGNIRGWAGPLPDSWHPRSLNLQRQIVQRMRDLGIITVLPGFSGHVPRAFQRLFPEAKIIKLKTWNNFQDKYCCPYLLDPTDQLFITIGITFMQEQIAEFGTDHVYNCDTFNEMVPQNGDTDYLRNISTSIYSSMTDADPKAIWLLQSWMFYSEILYWNKSLVKAFISAVPKGRMIILDLQSEQFPQYNRLESYFGQPFIWCMLHNFGGTLGMFGSANIINTETFNGRNFENSTMIGTGLTPEGINQNYVIYDLMTEMFWRKEPANLNEWFKMYAIRRYGQQNEYAIKAWNILSTTVYDYNSIQKMRGKYIVSRSPKLNLKPTFWYNTTEFMYAWDNLLTAQDDLKENLGYKHDLVDVTRQVLQIFGDLYYNELIRSFRKKKINKFMFLQNEFKQLFDDLEIILSTNEAFLLGKWLKSAKSIATNPEESRLYEFNARNQISLWGPRGEIKDYANKQWAGVVSSLFGRRWAMFLEAMRESLTTGHPFNETRVAGCVFAEVEAPFATDTNEFPVNTTGDTVAVAMEIHKRWRNKQTIQIFKKKIRGRHQRSSEELEIYGPHVTNV